MKSVTICRVLGTWYFTACSCVTASGRSMIPHAMLGIRFGRVDEVPITTPTIIFSAVSGKGIPPLSQDSWSSTVEGHTDLPLSDACRRIQSSYETYGFEAANGKYDSPGDVHCCSSLPGCQEQDHGVVESARRCWTWPNVGSSYALRGDIYWAGRLQNLENKPGRVLGQCSDVFQYRDYWQSIVCVVLQPVQYQTARSQECPSCR